MVLPVYELPDVFVLSFPDMKTVELPLGKIVRFFHYTKRYSSTIVVILCKASCNSLSKA